MKGKIPKREQLTNETLRALFRNNFKLANQAIQLGRFYIRSGHEISIEKLLDEIRRNPQEDYVKDLQALDQIEEDGTE
jgi:hypothetical protein